MRFVLKKDKQETLNQIIELGLRVVATEEVIRRLKDDYGLHATSTPNQRQLVSLLARGIMGFYIKQDGNYDHDMINFIVSAFIVQQRLRYK